MDQVEFDKLSKQGKISIVGELINETKYRILAPAEQNPESFDCHYVIPQNEQLKQLEVLSNSKSPVFIESAEILFSLTSLSKALHILYENRDLMGIALPCNIKVIIQEKQNFPMYDVNFFISLQELEIRVGEQEPYVDTVPMGMLTFQTEHGDQYFINIQLPSLYATLTQIKEEGNV